MADTRDEIVDTDADTRDDISNEDSSRDIVVHDTDADTRDIMERFNGIDSAIERITNAIEVLANGIRSNTSVSCESVVKPDKGFKRIEELNL